MMRVQIYFPSCHLLSSLFSSLFIDLSARSLKRLSSDSPLSLPLSADSQNKKINKIKLISNHKLLNFKIFKRIKRKSTIPTSLASDLCFFAFLVFLCFLCFLCFFSFFFFLPLASPSLSCKKQTKFINSLIQTLTGKKKTE